MSTEETGLRGHDDQEEGGLDAEIPFIAEADGADAAKSPGYTVRRLERLLSIASKLRDAGWPMWFTICGLAFEAPVSGEDDAEEEIRGLLADLGIDEPFSLFPGRRLTELREAAGKLADRVWYERKLVMIHEPGYDGKEEMRERPDIIQGMLANMAQIEQEGLEKEFPVEGDFDWGMVNGKLSALGWAMGDEWDDLDT
jgi:hypothetical protein